MQVKLSFGRAPLSVEIDDSLIGEIINHPQYNTISWQDIEQNLCNVLNNPHGTVPFEEWLKGARSAVLIVPDNTRFYPLDLILPPVLKICSKSGIKNYTIIVAHGTHSPQMPQHLQDALDKIDANYDIEIELHNCKDEIYLFSWGNLPLPNLNDEERKLIKSYINLRENRVIKLNKKLQDAERIISFGTILPHSIAGFAGGSKMIFPGTGDYQSVVENHSFRVSSSVRLGVVNGNIARDEMDRIGSSFSNLFCIDIVMGHKLPIGVTAGEPLLSHKEGVKLALSRIAVPVKPSHIVLSSISAPMSDTLYQLTKAVAVAQQILIKPGVVIVVGEANNGIGDTDGLKRIVNLGIKRYLPENSLLILVSRLKKEVVDSTGFVYAKSVNDALKMAYDFIGDKKPVTIFPHAYPLVPYI